MTEYTEADERADTAFLVGAAYGKSRVAPLVREWVKDVAYDEDDFVVEQDDLKRLLDVIDPGWRIAFEKNPPPAKVNPVITMERERLDDMLCDALNAARGGRYDGATVERHLERLIERVRNGVL